MARGLHAEPSPTTDADSPPTSEAPRRSRFRRARTLRGALGVTVLGAVLPGAGYVWTGRRLGYLVLVPALIGAVLAVVFVSDVDALLKFALDPARLRPAAAVLAAALLVWVLVVVTTYLMARPRDLTRGRSALGAVLVLLLCAGVAVPVGIGAKYAVTQADLVSTVFQHNESATAPRDVTAADPWGGRKRVSILILGGDGAPARPGIRTDSVVLLSMSTRTGRATMFSLPRNMLNAQFPENSPLHEHFPDGFRGDGDQANWMLNAIYGQVPALYPGLLGKSDNEGADALKQAVAGSLGTRVDYYMLVNLAGFQQIVDAMGGVTVNINRPVAIGGNTDLGIPPDDYLQPGPDQHLDGFHAMWFARGRWGSTDYQRMLRQRCLLGALIDEAKPLNLIRRYEALAAAGKEIVRTDLPSKLLPAFVDLAVKVKATPVRSVAFVSSREFFSGDPDFEWMQSVVDRALAPPPQGDASSSGDKPADPTPRTTEADGQQDGQRDGQQEEDPGSAVQVSDSCGYQPAD